MPAPSRSILWLISGLFCGLIALVVLVLGLTAIQYTHRKVRIHEEILAKDTRDFDNAPTAAKRDQAFRLIMHDHDMLDRFEGYRWAAIAVTAASIIPGIIGMILFGAFFLKPRGVATGTS